MRADREGLKRRARILSVSPDCRLPGLAWLLNSASRLLSVFGLNIDEMLPDIHPSLFRELTDTREGAGEAARAERAAAASLRQRMEKQSAAMTELHGRLEAEFAAHSKVKSARRVRCSIGGKSDAFAKSVCVRLCSDAM